MWKRTVSNDTAKAPLAGELLFCWSEYSYILPRFFKDAFRRSFVNMKLPVLNFIFQCVALNVHVTIADNFVRVVLNIPIGKFKNQTVIAELNFLPSTRSRWRNAEVCKMSTLDTGPFTFNRTANTYSHNQDKRDQQANTKNLKKGDEVLITESEHASNVLPWFMLKKELGIEVKYIPLDKNGEVTIENVEKAISNRTKVISLAYVTNVIGDIRPMRDIIELAHRYGILVVGDGAQSISHIKTDVMVDDVDFFVASGHKMYGPTGIGFLYGKFNLLNDMDPICYGGGMNAMYLSDGYVELREVPTKFEAGTQNIAGVIGMVEAITYLESIGIKNIIKHDHELKEYLVKKLEELDNVIIYNKDNVGSIVAFNVKDIFSQDVAVYLDKYHICVRSGNHCAKTLNQVFNVNNTCRVSFSFYNTYDEIDRFIEILGKIENIWEDIL